MKTAGSLLVAALMLSAAPAISAECGRWVPCDEASGPSVRSLTSTAIGRTLSPGRPRSRRLRPNRQRRRSLPKRRPEPVPARANSVSLKRLPAPSQPQRSPPRPKPRQPMMRKSISRRSRPKRKRLRAPILPRSMPPRHRKLDMGSAAQSQRTAAAA
jgi:hypothetical protein